MPDQKSKKKKKSKKKGTGTNNAPTLTPTTPADTDTQEVTESPIDVKETPDEDDESEQEEGTVAPPAPAQQPQANEPPIAQQPEEPPTEQTNATPPPDPTSNITNGVAKTTLEDADEKENDTAARFDALVADRDALRHEVTELRKSLESLQSKHETEIETLQENLADTQAEKENAEEQYQNLLGKVNTIRSQLGERLKADAVRLPTLHALPLPVPSLRVYLTETIGRSIPSTHTHR